MRKKLGVVVAAAVFSLLLTGFPALAGGKVQGGKFINGQPAGWSRGAKKGWQKKGAVAPPGIQKKGRLPKGLQKKALQYPNLSHTYLTPNRDPAKSLCVSAVAPSYGGLGVAGLNQARTYLPQQPPNLEIITSNMTAITISHSIR